MSAGIATAPAAAGISHVRVGEVDLEVWTGGSGRTLLLLHPGDGLDHQAQFLRALARRHRVVAPSHPGFGESSLPAWMNSVDDLAYFYLDFIEQQELSDVLLVGVSFGAWIAAEIAIRCRHALAGAVFVDAVGVKFGAPTEREILDLFAYPVYEQYRHLHADPSRHAPDYAARSDAELASRARNHASFALFGWSPTLHNPKLRRHLHRVTVPSLVLWGAEDRVVAPEYGRRFAQAIPGARFRPIEGAGHYPQVDQPGLFVAAIEEFSAGLAAPKGGA